ncbi:MAG: tetratricopeptide repeat protein [Candidatus Cloacimonetes bacterium]|nr:tetratricopeptide repeat protein [Candidatus Cloacimonadota bacterium]
MKKLNFLLLLLILVGISVLSAQTKVAVLGFEKNDRDSGNITTSMMKRDFNKIFEGNPVYKLMELKKTGNVVKAEGYSDLNLLGRKQLTDLGAKLEAEILIWGDVSSLSRSEYKITAKIMILRTKNIEVLSFTIPNKSKERQAILKKELVDRITTLIEEERNELKNIAMMQFDSDNYPEAETLFQKLLTADPSYIEAYVYLGYMKFLEGDFASAEQYYKEGLKTNPKHEEFLIYLGSVYRRQNKHQEAISTLLIIAEDKNEAPLWLTIGNSYADLGDIDAAIENLERALEINPEYDKAHLRLAFIYYDDENYEDALEYLEFVSESALNNEDIEGKLAKAYKESGKLDSAIAQYRSNIEKDPANAKAYMKLVSAYLSAGVNAESAKRLEYFNQALTTLQQLKQIAPDDIRVDFRTADVYRIIGDEIGGTKAAVHYRTALETLEKVIATKSQEAQVYSRLADVNILLKQFHAAETNAKKFAKYAPEQHEPYMALARIYFGQATGKYNKFVELEAEGNSGNLYGAEQDAILVQRDNTKKEAYDLFVKCQNSLKKAIAKADSQMTANSIKKFQSAIELIKYLKATKPSFMDS